MKAIALGFLAGLALIYAATADKTLKCSTLTVTKSIELVNAQGDVVCRIVVGEDRAQLMFEKDASATELRHWTVVDYDGVTHACKDGLVVMHEH